MADLLGLTDLWSRVVDFFTISPFWYYLFWGIVIAASATLAAWFFPVLRSLAGAIVLAVIGGLYAYRKGETDAEAQQRQRETRDAKRHDTSTGGWPFG
jgi:CHASE2 domain-containing sensor protein